MFKFEKKKVQNPAFVHLKRNCFENTLHRKITKRYTEVNNDCHIWTICEFISCLKETSARDSF